MIGTKICNKCHQELKFVEFYKDKTHKFGLTSRCKKCHGEYDRQYRINHRDQIIQQHKQWYEDHPGYTAERNHRTGRSQPMSENKECSSYLGVHIAERVLSAVFQNVERMPNGNPGFDFICAKGKKVDVKSACLCYSEHRSPYWHFKINRNTTADAFLCIAFDNRESLTPIHIWLIPANEVNHLVRLRITNIPESLEKWFKFEKPLDKVLECCNVLRNKPIVTVAESAIA